MADASSRDRRVTGAGRPPAPSATKRAARTLQQRFVDEGVAVTRLRRSLLMLAGVVTFGTVGYMLIEGWNVWDALYMTVISVTTAGYREVHPLSRRGELFTMVVLTVGVATVLYSFSFVMARLVEGDLESRWVRRRRERMLDELTNHFIICGFGRMGLIIAQEFVRQSVPFVDHRARSGPDAAGDRRRLPRGRSRCQQRAGPEAGAASIARAASSPRSAPTPRTSMRC